jgi:RNA polymerase sigma factor (sigma-70 family)
MDLADAERLFRDHGHVVLRRARRLLRSEEDAREALQDIFTRLIGAAQPFAGRSSPTTFLYAVTTNYCLQRIRDRRRRERLLRERGPLPSSTMGAQAEAAALVTQLLAKMPEELAPVVVYYYLDQMSQEEIAGILGCSRRHVGDLLEAGRAWIAENERRVA